MAEKRGADATEPTIIAGADSVENINAPKKRKTIDIVPDFNSLTWKLWLLLNYEYKEFSFTLMDDVLLHSFKDKEHLACDDPTKPMLFKAMEEIFVKVTYGKKGGKNERRKTCYKNLKEKDRKEFTREENGTAIDVSSQMDELSGLKDAIPSNWVIVTDRPDRVSFVRMERWEFCDRRVCVDLLVAVHHEHPNKVSFTLRSHGSMVNLNDVMDFDNVLKGLTVPAKVVIAIELIEKSSLCEGDLLSEETVERVQLDPLSVVGEFLGHCSAGITTKCTRLFSKKCELFASRERLICRKCNQHIKTQKHRESRNKERAHTGSSQCNFRYMTRKELEDQLRLERQKNVNFKRRYELVCKQHGQDDSENDDGNEDDSEEFNADFEDEISEAGDEGGEVGDENGDTGKEAGEAEDEDDESGNKDDKTGDQGDVSKDGDGEDDVVGGELRMKIKMTGKNATVVNSRSVFDS